MEAICYFCNDLVKLNARVHLRTLVNENIDIPKFRKTALDVTADPSAFNTAAIICGECHSTLLQFHEADQMMNQLGLGKLKNNSEINFAKRKVNSRSRGKIIAEDLEKKL